MARSDRTSAIIDGILRFLVTGGALSAGIVAPNLILALDKPLQKHFNSLDKKARERELSRITAYMKHQKLLSENYQHGLVITKKAKVRLNKSEFDQLYINQPLAWDRKWRLVLFDIPEEEREARTMLTTKLRSIGFQLLQQSVWIHPFPSREIIETICNKYEVAKYTTYIETAHIDHEEHLIKRFEKLINKIDGRYIYQ